MAIELRAADLTVPKEIIEHLGRQLVRLEGVSPKKSRDYGQALASVEEALRTLFEERIRALKYGLTEINALLLDGFLKLTELHPETFKLKSIKALIAEKLHEIDSVQRRR